MSKDETTRRHRAALDSSRLSAFKLFGKINDGTFRKSVLALPLFAGLVLTALALALSFGPLMLDPFPPSAPPM